MATAERLRIVKAEEGLVQFSMASVTVDGIMGKNPATMYERLLFSYKEMSDPGQAWRWSPEDSHRIDEKHWLSHGHVVELREFCYHCGEYINE